MEGSNRPRRAAGPAPDEWNEPTSSSAARPAGPLFDDPQELSDTGMMRRLALNPDGSLGNLAVPPPRPVLPMSEAAPASAGRRFSADDAPFDGEWAAPRRSAASVSSPPGRYEPLLPPVARPTAPPAVTVSYPSASEPPTGTFPVAPLAPQPVAPSPVAPPAPTPASTAGTRASARSQATPAARAIEPEPKPSRKEAKAAAAQAKAEAKAAQDAERAAAKEAAQQARLDARSAKADAKAAQAEAKAAKTASQSKAKPGRVAHIDPASRLAVGGGDRSTPGAAFTPIAPPPPAREGSKRAAIIVIAAVLAVALIVGGVVMAMALRPLASSGPGGGAAVDPLISPASAAALGTGSWQETTATGTAVCIGDAAPKAERAASRKLFSGDNSVLQVMNVYPDDSSAIQAYNAVASLAGTCPDGAAMVASASDIKGLADSAQAVQLSVQGVKTENHLMVIARTGRSVNVFDIASATSVPVTTAAQVAATSLTQQCGSGTCPVGVSVASSLPAAGSPPGWLVPADLPRITPGVGKWTAHDWPVNTPGSQCEGTDLTKITGTVNSGQRTLILTEDPKTPASFGVDQVVFTYSENKPASALATNLINSIGDCAQLGTASVTDGPDIKGSGLGGTVVSGRTWEITHKTTTATFVYRVAVVTAGSRVVYLVATPTKTYDFTDADWGAMALRAGQRATQAG